MELQLNLKQIKEYQQNREPYLMIDFAEKVVPGKLANGYKILKKNEWFFKVHWPGDPNMPGMLQIESLVQMSALALLTLPSNKGKIVYLIDANNLKFKRKIVPGDILNINTNILSFKRGLAKVKGEGFVNKELACKADFTVIMPDELEKYRIK